MNPGGAIQTVPASDPALANAFSKIRGLMVPGEEIQAFAVQERICALLEFGRRAIIVATTGRVVAIRRGLLGGFTMNDLQWQDVRDARIRETMLGAVINVNAYAGQAFQVSGLNKTDAQKVYVICQQQEQAWREKNRVRKMEEARGGYAPQGIPLGLGSGHAHAQAAPSDPTAKLQQAKGMFEQGLITESEYEAIKAKVFAHF